MFRGGDVDDLASVKEAIAHLYEVPVTERGAAWYAYRDSLTAQQIELEQR